MHHFNQVYEIVLLRRCTCCGERNIDFVDALHHAEVLKPLRTLWDTKNIRTLPNPKSMSRRLRRFAGNASRANQGRYAENERE
jgi:hypothetical protein